MESREDIIAALTAEGGSFELATESNEYGSPIVYYATGPRTLRDVLLASRQHGDAIFLVYEDERISYAEHFSRVAQLARWMLEQGIGKGDRVAIGMRNYPEWVIALFACQAIGAIAVTLNAWWTGNELVYGLTDSGTRLAIIDDERYGRLAPLRGQISDTQLLVTRDIQRTADAEHLEDIVKPGAAAELPDITIEPADYSTILYTSGTTGFPKGALHTHRNHVTNIGNTMLGGAVTAALVSAGQPATAETPPQAASLQTFPFFHIGGISGLYVSAYAGSRLVLMYKWDVEQAIDLIEREQVRSWAGVPTVVRQLLEHPRAQSGALDSLASVASGGAPVPEDLIDRVGSMFEARVSPGNGYGATETTSAIISNGGADYLARPNSVGRPAITVDARIVDDNGVDCNQGEIGEIWIRGANIFAGYWNKPEETADSFHEDWFKTGDLGYQDAAGFFYVVDRKKDVIIRGGENIYCAEVEGVIFKHPGVADVALIGLPHRHYGEEVAAIVEPKPATNLTAEDIQAFVAERLASFNVPTHVFFVNEPLPRTATGKVLKRDLKQHYAAQLGG